MRKALLFSGTSEGSLTEGVSFAILIGNILVPLIERATRPRAFGTKRRLLRHEK